MGAQTDKKRASMKRDTEQLREKFNNIFCCSDDGVDVLNAIKEHGGIGRELFAQDQLTQNRNVAMHDFACWIVGMTKKVKK